MVSSLLGGLVIGWVVGAHLSSYILSAAVILPLPLLWAQICSVLNLP